MRGWPTLDNWASAGFVLSPEDMRPLSVAELQKRALEQAAATQQYQPTLAEMLGALNYRPPVHVPEGWAYWSKHAGEIA